MKSIRCLLIALLMQLSVYGGVAQTSGSDYASYRAEPAAWDTVTSHRYMFDPDHTPSGDCVALAISNFGEIGLAGIGTVNLDFVESGLECGTRPSDAAYLKSGSPFVILADNSAGANARLTCSYMDVDAADPNGWKPTSAKGSIRGGVSVDGDYDSVYTGQFVNRDTTIAVERTFFAPRQTSAYYPVSYVICLTKFYSADGSPHDHVTIGSVVDWNVPSDRECVNHCLTSSAGFIALQGTDSIGSESCQSNLRRFAAEAFVTSYTSAERAAYPCAWHEDALYGMTALSRSMLDDTTHYRDGSPLVPAQPNPLLWWYEMGTPGLNESSVNGDLAIWLTYRYDLSLVADDTINVWTILVTARDGTVTELNELTRMALCGYPALPVECHPENACCVGRVGDANGSGEDAPTIGDVSVMIDAKFITGHCVGDPPGKNIVCLFEADINRSGYSNITCDDITIGDISILIDFLFITGPSLELPDCWHGIGGCPY